MQVREDTQRRSFRPVPVTTGTALTPTGAVQQSEREFIDAVLAGDLDARDRLVKRMVCMPRFVRSLQRRVRLSQADLEDLTQESFRRFWATLGSFRCECSLEAWAFRVVRSTIRETRRTERARRSTAIDPLHLCELPDEDHGECASSPYSGSYEQDAMLRAFDALPESVRDLIHARAVERVPYAELAETFGMTPEVGSPGTELEFAL